MLKVGPKVPSAKRYIKDDIVLRDAGIADVMSESTERHRVH